MDPKWLKVKITVSVQLQRAINDTRQWISVLSRWQRLVIKNTNWFICFIHKCINTNARLFCDARSWCYVIRNYAEKATRKGQGQRPLLDARGLQALSDTASFIGKILSLTLLNGHNPPCHLQMPTKLHYTALSCRKEAIFEHGPEAPSCPVG